jgi:hypothetical protein
LVCKYWKTPIHVILRRQRASRARASWSAGTLSSRGRSGAEGASSRQPPTRPAIVEAAGGCRSPRRKRWRDGSDSGEVPASPEIALAFAGVSCETVGLVNSL